jgi:hypothetical protein
MTVRHGFPQVYWQFLANVSLSGHSDVILPFPVTSSCAAAILSHYGVVADLIYIDAGHEEDEVLIDLKRFWPLLRPGGYMIGDDYADYWPGVVKAVLTFFAERGRRVASQQAKWVVRKPAAGAPLTRRGRA